MTILTVVRGGGDLASGVIYRLYKAGISTLVTELPHPLAVRRKVSFAQAVYEHQINIEGIRAQLISKPEDADSCVQLGLVPVLVDPNVSCLPVLNPLVVVDGRMRKKPSELAYPAEWFTIGLGPGFTVGENCDAAIETKRGHFLGRVYWQGSPEPDTGKPERVENREAERVIRAPDDGILETLVEIGDQVQEGQALAKVGELTVFAQFSGIIRGMVINGLTVTRGMKIGDLDPRNNPVYSHMISDKALAVGGGVLEAILSKPQLRQQLWREV